MSPPSPFFGRSSLYSWRHASMMAWAMRQRREPVLVEALVSESAVERFDEGVLVRLAGVDQAQRDAPLVRPGQHRAPTEFRSVVGPQDARQPPLVRQAVEHAGDGQAAERPPRHDGYGLGRRIVRRSSSTSPPAPRPSGRRRSRRTTPRSGPGVAPAVDGRRPGSSCVAAAVSASAPRCTGARRVCG